MISQENLNENDEKCLHHYFSAIEIEKKLCFQNYKMVFDGAHVDFGTCNCLPTTFSLARETKRGLDKRKARIENKGH